MTMNPSRFAGFSSAATLGAAAVLLAFAPGLASAQNITRAEMRAESARIAADAKKAERACRRLRGAEREVCEEEAEAAEEVALAELRWRDTKSPRDAYRLAMARAESAREVARDRCALRPSAERDVCREEAKTAYVKAAADAKAAREGTPEARMDAEETKREADYRLARERCDTLAGAAERRCEQDALRRYAR